MKTNISDTSIAAIHQLRADGVNLTQRQQILDCVAHELSPVTRREISILTGIELSAVCGRVNALVSEGSLVETHKAPCPVTKRSAWFVALPTSREAA